MSKEPAPKFQNEKQRFWIVILLALSCLTAVLLLWTSEPVVSNHINTSSQLDSLIAITLEDMDILNDQIRRNSVEIDSVFSRNTYTVRVSPEFSKTTLHYHLQRRFLPYRVETAARVHFPDRDMTIHLIMNNNVRRTLTVISDPRFAR